MGKKSYFDRKFRFWNFEFFGPKMEFVQPRGNLYVFRKLLSVDARPFSFCALRLSVCFVLIIA